MICQKLLGVLKNWHLHFRDQYQRNSSSRGIQDCEDNEIMISDLDEIL